jgi:PAS domain-containing protein
MSPAAAWVWLAVDAPDGLAVVNSEGLFVQLNPAGARLCGRAETELIGAKSPFGLVRDSGGEQAGLFEDGTNEQVTVWSAAPGIRRNSLIARSACRGTPLLSWSHSATSRANGTDGGAWRLSRAPGRDWHHRAR